MLRKTLTICSLIGLLLSLAAWGVSCYGATYKKVSKTKGMEFFAYNGMVVLLTYTCTEEDMSPLVVREWSFGVPHPLESNYLFIPWFESEADDMVQFSSLFLPLYLPVFIFAILPLLVVRLIHRRRKRKNLGLCVTCGYSLHGLTEPRCPECFTPFEMSRLQPAAGSHQDATP